MAFTNVYTTAAPLDTQAASQGAADFRATKLDVMQRIASFTQGLLANRPTPETTSASVSWGTPGGPGVMYWATDTKQVFGWTGTAWQDISANIPGSGTRYSDTTTIVRATPNAVGSDQLENSLTILAGSMAIGDVVNITDRFIVNYSGVPSTAGANVKLAIGGTTLFAVGITDVSGEYIIQHQFTLISNTVLRGITTCIPPSGILITGLSDWVVADVSANNTLVAILKDVVGGGGTTNNNTFTFDYLTAVID